MRISDWSSDVCSSDLALQADLLARAARWVKPGGTLVYATCSLERAESEDQIAAFLTRHADWTVDPVRPDELPDARSEEHTSELQSLMRISYAVFCLQKKKTVRTPKKSQRRNINNQ